MNEGKIHETSKPTKMRMENEPWDSALFDWKPKKCMLVRGFNAQTDKEQILYLIL